MKINIYIILNKLPFKVKAPLFVARQWMRHRTWSYNELSRRYSNAPMDFYIPEERFSRESRYSDVNKVIIDIIEKATQSALSQYENLTNGYGLVNELARIILPVNLYTIFYAKVDLHNLFHFLELRRTPHAQYEIREYAKTIEKLILPIVPKTYQLWLHRLNGTLDKI